VQQIAWRCVADRLDHTLCDPRARRMRGDTYVDDPATVEGDDDERVERLEVHGDHREEVAGPNLRGVVPEKGPPGLTAATLRVLRAVLRDRARRDGPAELREPAIRFSPHRRFSRHMRRMMARSSASIGGRPTGRLER
jgi:hypothetical protein